MDTQEKRLVELFGELPEDYRGLLMDQLEAMVNPNEAIREEIERETQEALSDPIYRAELALECGGFMPTEQGERLMNDPTTRAYFGREIQNDLPALDGKHLLAVALLVANLSKNAEAPTPEA
jgi:hypothetical protein